jgi:hypothetical protein
MEQARNRWKDPVLWIFLIGTIAALGVSSTPTYQWISLFHSTSDENKAWGIFLSVLALIVFEGGGVISKIMVIWVPLWEKQLTRYMIFSLFLLFVTNLASGWDSIHSVVISHSSIYASIRDGSFTSITTTVLYAASFPILQGIFISGFVARWNSLNEEVTTIQLLNNEIAQLTRTYEINLENMQSIHQFELNEKQEALTYIADDRDYLNGRVQELCKQLEERPIMIDSTEETIQVAKKQFTLDSFTAALNDFMMRNGREIISRASINRMIEKVGQEEVLE